MKIRYTLGYIVFWCIVLVSVDAFAETNYMCHTITPETGSTAASRTKVEANGTIQSDATGYLIAPTVELKPGFTVDGGLVVITADPCPHISEGEPCPVILQTIEVVGEGSKVN